MQKCLSLLLGHQTHFLYFYWILPLSPSTSLQHWPLVQTPPILFNDLVGFNLTWKLINSDISKYLHTVWPGKEIDLKNKVLASLSFVVFSAAFNIFSLIFCSKEQCNDYRQWTEIKITVQTWNFQISHKQLISVLIRGWFLLIQLNSVDECWNKNDKEKTHNFSRVLPSYLIF